MKKAITLLFLSTLAAWKITGPKAIHCAASFASNADFVSLEKNFILF